MRSTDLLNCKQELLLETPLKKTTKQESRLTVTLERI